MFFLCVPSFLSLLVSNNKQINIYINLIIKTIIITIIILGTFSCPCCVCVVRLLFPVGSRGLLKLSQHGRSWQAGKCWERCRRWSGTGGCSLLRISAVSVTLYFCENNGISAGHRRYSDFRITIWILMATLDSSYIKCYNKCNDDNKKAIGHHSPKFAL